MEKTNGSENAEAPQDDQAAGGAQEGANASVQTAEVNPLAAELDERAARILALEGDLSDTQAQLADCQSFLLKTAKERDDLAAKLAKLDAEPKAAKGARAVKARKCGPVDNPPSLEDLQELIGMADTVELVFSDGKRELAIEPRLISGKAWSMTAVGLALRLPEFPVVGPALGPVSIAGYGLFLNGEQVAWASRGEPMEVPPGRRMDLRNDVVFAA